MLGLRTLVGSFGPKLKQFALGENDRPLSSRQMNVQRETLNSQPSTPHSAGSKQVVSNFRAGRPEEPVVNVEAQELGRLASI